MSEIQDIIDSFDLLGDWDTRYQYLIELGEHLAAMPAELKDDEHLVKGCMSTVHTAALPDPDQPGKIFYHGDCDTAVIKGVVALVVNLLSHKTPQEVIDTDIDALFAGLKLQEHLSPNRHFGVYALIEQLKKQASDLA